MVEANVWEIQGYLSWTVECEEPLFPAADSKPGFGEVLARTTERMSAPRTLPWSSGDFVRARRSSIRRMRTS